jgi:hypothetical protein
VEPLSEQQWTDLFGACQRSAWHLEMRDSYGVDEEKGRFAEFLRTGRRDETADAEQRRHWTGLMRATTGAGKQVRRARIVSEPVADYIRWEWAGTPLNIEAGEEVRWLPRLRASGIALPGNDFWLFDRERVLFNHFTGDGRSAGQELVTDAEAVRLCESAFEAVWALAVPHDKYQIV